RTVYAGDAKALNWNPPQQLIASARALLDAPSKTAEPATSPGAIAACVSQLAREALTRGQNLHHPHYVGHQVPAPVPLAALFDLIGSVTNQAMAIYEMGPWATAVEHAIIAAIGEQIGFSASTFAGLVTSGGSMANLTALLTARNITLGDAWTAGL